MKKIAIIGASIGGLVAAAELRERGFEVTIIERGRSVGGLYGKVDTPFGMQELGMHVLYLSDNHYRHMCTIFGEDAFQTWQGYTVDIGSCHNFGRNFFDSIYPDVRALPSAGKVLVQLLEKNGEDKAPLNALESVIGRFGKEAGEKIIAPILKKLWKQEAEQLTENAIHCFFDLRRIVVCDKGQADKLKTEDPWLDSVVANPLQSQPSGRVFGGRRAVMFKNSLGDISSKVLASLTREGIDIQFERSVDIVDQHLVLDGIAVDKSFDGCIVATPLASMAPQLAQTLDQLDLSIYYCKLTESLKDSFPAYYILCHASELLASRIVNYDAYHTEKREDGQPVIAVEVLHDLNKPPTEDVVAAEVVKVLPSAKVDECYRLPKSLRIQSPSLKNAKCLDALSDGMDAHFSHEALFFAGMRTDKGIFFSHHTVGTAYDAALECARRLS